MDITQAYAVAASGIAFTFLSANLFSHFGGFGHSVSLLTSKHLTSAYLLNRHGLLGPWSRYYVVLQLAYLAVNVFCLSFRVADISSAGLRAGTLSLINLIPFSAALTSASSQTYLAFD